MSRGKGLLLLATLTVIFLACTFKPTVSGDGVGYFSYLHSIFVDHDLDMSDEYAAAFSENIDVWRPQYTARTSTGLLANQFPIGPALLSAPSYLAALAIKPAGHPQLEAPYTTAYTLASLLFGLLALAVSFRFARAVVGSSSAAAAGVLGVGLTTPFLYYLVYQPSYSHMFSAFMVSTFIYVWWTTRGRRSTWGWLILGALGGGMALVRWQDGPLMAVTLLDVPRDRWRLLLLAPGALLAFVPQLVVDRVIFGTWLPVRPASEALDFFHGHYLQVLFGSWHGLFTWTPAAAIAVAGWFLVRDRTLRLAFIISFVIQVALIGAYPVWWGGFAFGMRYLLNLTPFFVIGLAAVAARLKPAVIAGALGLLALWNVLLILNLSFVIGRDVDPGYTALLRGQLHAVRYLPHLVQGYVARSLVLWPLLRRPPDAIGGIAVLLAQTAAVLASLWWAMRGRRPLPVAAAVPLTSSSARR